MQIVNTDQADAWDGDEGRLWAENEDRYNAASARHGTVLLEAARIAPDERVLDIGCGCGASTRAAARAASRGTALGVDLSRAMLDRAIQRAEAEGLRNVRFEQADAQVQPFARHAFDLVISKFGVMFFSDPVAAFTNIGGSLRPGGRLTVAVWQDLARNEWVQLIRTTLAAGRDLPEPPPGAPSPFSMGDRAGTTAMLTAAGFRAITFEDVDEPLVFGKDAADAYDFMTQTGAARALVDGIEDAALKRTTLDAFREMLQAHETPDGVLLASRAWIITARCT